MKRTARVIVVVALPFLFGAVGTACGGGRATSDASTTGKGGGSGSAGMGGGAGDGAGGIDGGAGGTAGAAGTGGGSGTTGRGGGTGGGGTGGGGTSGGGTGGGGTGGGGTGGGGGTVSGDAGTTPCGNTACVAGQICVRSVIGAASYVCPDAGHVTFPPNCDGRLTDANGCCYGAESNIYSCAARPSGCGATITCSCASTLCTLGACLELGANDELTCLGAGP